MGRSMGKALLQAPISVHQWLNNFSGFNTKAKIRCLRSILDAYYLLMTTTEKPKIVAWLKPTCGWSAGVRAVFKKYNLAFEDRDIINRPEYRMEMIEKSGQMLSPCVEINGQMLPDISGEEVEAWMLAQGLVVPNDAMPEAPINQPCADELPGGRPLEMRR